MIRAESSRGSGREDGSRKNKEEESTGRATKLDVGMWGWRRGPGWSPEICCRQPGVFHRGGGHRAGGRGAAFRQRWILNVPGLRWMCKLALAARMQLHLKQNKPLLSQWDSLSPSEAVGESTEACVTQGSASGHKATLQFSMFSLYSGSTLSQKPFITQ